MPSLKKSLLFIVAFSFSMLSFASPQPDDTFYESPTQKADSFTVAEVGIFTVAESGDKLPKLSLDSKALKALSLDTSRVMIAKSLGTGNSILQNHYASLNSKKAWRAEYKKYQSKIFNKKSSYHYLC